MMSNTWWTSDDVYCVPAFLSSAINELQGISISVEKLARDLGVRVRPGDANPWNLSVSDEKHVAGVTLVEAINGISRVLATRSSELSFAHVPFNTIAFRDAELYFNEHDRPGVYIGVGLNWNVLAGVQGRSMHVVRILSYGPQVVTIWDPTRAETPAEKVMAAKLERAVLDQDDGFWIVKALKA